MVKRLLNTLYVTTEGAYLRKYGEIVAVEVDEATRAWMPVHLLEQIVLFGEAAMSRDLMAQAAETGTSVAWLTILETRGRPERPQTGNVLPRRAQHRATNDPAVAMPAARAVVAAKFADQRALLRRLMSAARHAIR